MSANLSVNIQHRVSLARKAEAMLMDFLSIYEVGSVLRIEDFDGLCLKSSLIKTQLDCTSSNLPTFLFKKSLVKWGMVIS